MTRTRIAWTDYTINPGIYGCSPVHSGCDHCYAATMARRLAGMGQGQYAGLTTPDGRWTGEVRADRYAIGRAFDGLPKRKPARVFVTSMGDLFHRDVEADHIEHVLDEMRAQPHHTFQVLTKRPGRAAKFNQRIPYPPNVQIGCSCSTQDDIDDMVPDLLRVPAAVRFLSMEPLLGPVNLESIMLNDEGMTHLFPLAGDVLYDGMNEPTMIKGGGISWVIVGCESGPRRRPCLLEWVRSVVEQCRNANVPVFVKQLDLGTRVSRDPSEWPDDLRVQEFPA